jgi:N-acetylmuramoyl-L-alanine amidase
VRFPATRRGPLTGFVVALDPGHALGNGSHPTQVNRRYWVGLWKSCNTTGTATARGYPESSYTFDVVARLRRLLVAQGATVVVTRDRNTRSTWGPCVGARGALGAQVGADLLLSVHADGAPARGRGFHVIAPGYKRGYTDDHYRESRVLARSMIRGMRAGGMAPTTYLSSTLSVRTDVGSANTSDVPTVTVETLNMRNAADARIATSRAGRQKVAAALYRGITAFLRAG